MKRLFGVGGATRLCFGLAAAVFMGCFWAGCGPTDPGNNNNTGNGGPLVLPSNYAWIMEDDEDEGVVFTADGRIFDIYKSGETWRIGNEGTYGTNGNKVIVYYGSNDSRNGTWEFEITDGGATLIATPTDDVSYGRTMFFTKTSGVSVKIPIPNPGTGGNLVCGSGQAWVVEEDGMAVVFQADGSLRIYRKFGAIWVIDADGSYTTNGGRITLLLSGEGMTTGTFTVTGNSFVMTIEGRSIVFTKMSGINFYDPSTPHTGGNLVTSANQAWVAEFDYDEAIGIVFKQDGTVQLLNRLLGANYEVYSEGIYEAVGTDVYIDTPREQMNASYSVKDNGNTLILTIRISDDEYGDIYEQTIGFTKKSGLTITRPTPVTQANLVLPSGQGWQDGTGSHREGYIFLQDGTVYDLDYGYATTGVWRIEQQGTYTIIDGGMTVQIEWDDKFYSEDYRVSYSNNTLRIDGSTYTIAAITLPTPVTVEDLVLSSGQAWQDGTGSHREGYMFLQDGTVYDLDYGYEVLGAWNIERQGTYTVSGDYVVITWESNSYSSQYRASRSGNTLIFDGDTYTIASGVDLSTPPPPPPPSGGNLVNTSGQAWIDDDGGEAGFVFGSDGSLKLIGEISTGTWMIVGEGTYSTNGGNISLSILGDVITGTYSVSGNGAVITVDGETLYFTKTSGLNIITNLTPTSGDLVLSSGYAWTSDDYGYLFDDNGTVSYIGYEYGDWYVYDEGTYTTSGTDISVYWPDWDEKEFGTYYFFDGKLILTLSEYTEILTKTSGVYPNYDYYYAQKAAPDGLRKSKRGDRVKSLKGLWKKSGTSSSVVSKALTKSRAAKPAAVSKPQTAKKPELKRPEPKKTAKRGGWSGAKFSGRLAKK